MIQRILHFLDRLSKTKITLTAVGISILLGIFDFATGVEIHFLLLYLIPIALGSWYVNRETGVYLAIFCSLIWAAADWPGGRAYSHPWIAYWNLFMHIGVVVLFSILLAQLRATFDGLSESAHTDFLTGLPNGRAFYQLAAEQIESAYGLEPLTLAFVDVAGLKWLNYRSGYAAGDQTMCIIAHTIKQNVLRPDLIGRIGGTSFALLLPNTDSEAARFLLDKIQGALKDGRRKYAHPVTFFISAIAYAKAPGSIAELMQQAESQMTRMKMGREDVFQITNVESVPVSLN
jgi:diguanylate cyclase (GGDEF)-like protein